MTGDVWIVASMAAMTQNQLRFQSLETENQDGLYSSNPFESQNNFIAAVLKHVQEIPKRVT